MESNATNATNVKSAPQARTLSHIPGLPVAAVGTSPESRVRVDVVHPSSFGGDSDPTRPARSYNETHRQIAPL